MVQLVRWFLGAPQGPGSQLASRSIPTSPLEVSGPPRSRSAARRRRGSVGSTRTRRSGRPARSREHQDVEQLGAGSGTKGPQAFTELSLDLV